MRLSIRASSQEDEDLELIVLHITPIDDVKLMGNILYIAGEAEAAS